MMYDKTNIVRFFEKLARHLAGHGGDYLQFFFNNNEVVLVAAEKIYANPLITKGIWGVCYLIDEKLPKLAYTAVNYRHSIIIRLGIGSSWDKVAKEILKILEIDEL